MDTEIEAMTSLLGVLQPLQQEVRVRVLSWAMVRFGVSTPTAQPLMESLAVSLGSENQGVRFATFADLFHASNPQKSGERALLAAFWATTTEGNETFASQDISKHLKELGYKVPNITDAIAQCSREKPALIIQIRKSGTSKQSRKTFKITDAGRRRVEEMIRTKEP